MCVFCGVFTPFTRPAYLLASHIGHFSTRARPAAARNLSPIDSDSRHICQVVKRRELPLAKWLSLCCYFFFYSYSRSRCCCLTTVASCQSTLSSLLLLLLSLCLLLRNTNADVLINVIIFAFAFEFAVPSVQGELVSLPLPQLLLLPALPAPPVHNFRFHTKRQLIESPLHTLAFKWGFN